MCYVNKDKTTPLICFIYQENYAALPGVEETEVMSIPLANPSIGFYSF